MSVEESVMKSAMTSGLDRDLENARVLIEDEPWCDSPHKYRKAAEIILRRVLTVDPNNKTARALLARAESPLNVDVSFSPAPERISVAESVESRPEPMRTVTEYATEEPAPFEAARVIEAAPWTESVSTVEAPHVRVMEPKPAYLSNAGRASSMETEPPRDAVPAAEPTITPEREEFPFLVQTLGTTPAKTRTGPSVPSLIGIGVAIVLSGFLMFGFPSKGKSQFPPARAAVPPAPAAEAPAAPPVSTTPPATVDSTPAPAQPATGLPVAPPTPAAAAPPTSVSPAPAAAVPLVASVPPKAPASVEPKAKAQSPASVQTGTLAVGSPTTVDIYMGDQLLGSAPTTLELPAGNQRLEFRHNGMKKVVTYVISANETTTTMVTFDIAVQINAKPWAQVFIEGSQRQSLGQTPLSDVLVPIGSVLTFENPNFQGKRYRVKGTETTIQVTFP